MCSVNKLINQISEPFYQQNAVYSGLLVDLTQNISQMFISGNGVLLQIVDFLSGLLNISVNFFTEHNVLKAKKPKRSVLKTFEMFLITILLHFQKHSVPKFGNRLSGNGNRWCSDLVPSYSYFQSYSKAITGFPERSGLRVFSCEHLKFQI